WTMKTSEPRTFSSIWQKISPSEKLNATTLPAARFRYSQISCTRAGWARPPKIFSSPNILTYSLLIHGRDRERALVPGELVGAGGFEPPDARSKVWCLTTWRRPRAKTTRYA